MKQLLPIFIFIFISFQAISQDVTVEPNPYINTFAVDLSTSNTEAIAHTEMVNNSSGTLNVKWVIVPGDNCPSEWKYLVCDKNNCYTTAVTTNQGGPVNNPVILAAGEKAILDLHIKPNQTAGSCIPKIEVRNYDDPSVLYQTADYDVKIDALSAATEREKANLKVFPNPTSNYISLSENHFVSKLWVSNILGKRVRTFRTSVGNNYDVSSLPDGIYLVSMVDEDNKVLKTVRISKRSIRP